MGDPPKQAGAPTLLLRVRAFDAAQHYAALAASHGFIVASRDTTPYEAAGVAVINPWEA